jgi:hypothetical protein
MDTKSTAITDTMTSNCKCEGFGIVGIALAVPFIIFFFIPVFIMVLIALMKSVLELLF